MGERLKIPNHIRLLPVTSPLEDQVTSELPVPDGVELQARLIPPKFSLKQRGNGHTALQTASVQSGSIWMFPAAEEATATLTSNTTSIVADGRELQTCHQTWRPGTFGFTNNDSDGSEQSNMLLMLSSPALQTKNATGISSGPHPPLPRHPRANLPAQVQSLSSTNAVSASTDQAPNVQKTSRAIVARLLSWGISVPIVFPMTALLTRYLGPTQYGEYSFTLSFLAVFALLSGTGLDPFIIRQLSRQAHKEWSETLSYAIGTRLLFTILSASVAILLAFWLPLAEEQRTLLLIGSASLLFSFSVNGLRATCMNGFVAEQRAGIVLLEAANRIITAGLVLLIVLLHLSLLWACFLIIYSDVPFFLVEVLAARRRYGIGVRFSFARIREHLLGSLTLTGYDALALMASQADVILLMWLAGSQSVGIYALASKLTDPLLSIVFAYVNGLYPLLCRNFEEGRERFVMIYHGAERILALVIVPLGIFVSVEAKAMVALLGGEHFAAATVVVQLLMWAMAASFLNQLAVRVCMAANMERQIPYVTAASVGVNVLANLVLIPHWLFIGAGVAALLSELTALCLYYVLLRRHVHPLKTLGMLLRVFLGCLPLFAFLLWLDLGAVDLAPAQSLLLAAPVAPLLAVIGCAATRVFSLKDVVVVRRFLFARQSEGKEPSERDTDKLPITRLWFQDITDLPTTILPRI